MRTKIRVLVLAAGASAIAACSGGGAGGNVTITGTTPPTDTAKKTLPPVATLDSVRRGFYDANNVLHLYPDTTGVVLPVQGAVFAVPFTNAIAFTSSGVVTDPASMQGMYGAFVLTSDNPAIVTPAGFCDSSGWACLKVLGVRGSSHVTLTLGTKSVTAVFVVQ